MRTLFSPDILSPAPESPPPSLLANPFELAYRSSPVISSSRSSQSSFGESDGLTEYLQNHHHLTVDALSGKARSTTRGRHGSPMRRKGDPKVLFMGLRRSGKSSVQKVIFEKMSPAETLYLDPTHKVQSATMKSFITLDSLELPANLPFTAPDFDHAAIFSSAGAIIWVLDMQDEYYSSIASLIRTAIFCREHYPRLNFEVFIHKTDGLSEEYKADTFRDVRQRVQDELTDTIASLPPQSPTNLSTSSISPSLHGHYAAGIGAGTVSFYATSVFDHSIYEATSKVVQKLLPQLPAVETLLNKLCSSCRIQKAYLFDVASKIYLATDASPTFLRDYEVCSDYVDVVLDIKQIYGWKRESSSPSGEGSDDGGIASELDVADAEGESTITFERGETYIYAREMNEYLTLICVMGQGSLPNTRVLIDYNVTVLKEALEKIFAV